MTKIYLSSTYEDLKEHRRVVFDALRKSGYQAIAMEDYVATDQRPVDKCLKDVAEADIYVGIFAFRYGYVPPAQHNNPKGLSITELEFRQAESLKKPCLTFVVNRSTPWPPDFMDALEAEDKGDRINTFRRYLLTEKLASSFSSPHELAALVLAAVRQCEQFEQEQKRAEEAKRLRSEASPTVTASRLAETATTRDIFISYKREEQPEARKLADALEREGWTVWWDPKLRAGDDFDKIIEALLNESRCVIVLWSELSVQSDYVRAEASEAMEQKKLVPVAIEKVTLPFRFKRLHTPMLLKWDGSAESIEFRKLVDDITQIIGPPKAKTQRASAARRPTTSQPSLKIDNRRPGTIFRDMLKDGSEGPEMIVIPSGTFQLGDIHGKGDKETPVHTVHIRNPFALGRYQVTFDEYDYYAKLTRRELPEDMEWGRGRRPAINVSLYDAVEYTTWLSAQTGRHYRLPSEAEWEYAARSGRKHEEWAGTSKVQELGDYAVFRKNKTEPVGSRKPNGLGLFDMSGNVWEWVEDCWHDDYNSAPADGSVWIGGDELGRRVLRGGSWCYYTPGDLRSSSRHRYDADKRDYDIGFRLAQDLP